MRCALCGRGFPGRGSLERHLREHEEETRGGQGGPDGTEGGQGNLADDQGLEDRLGGTESGPQLEDGATRPAEPSQSPIRAAGLEATEPASWGMGEADGWRGARGPVNHDGGWVPGGHVLTKPEDESGDSVPRSPCPLGNTQPNGPSLTPVDSWDSGDCGPQPQPESHSFSCSHCGKICQSEGPLNHHSTHKTDRHYCLLCSKEFLNPEATKSHSRNHIAAQTFSCPDCGEAFESHRELASHLQTHARGLSQVSPQVEARSPKAGAEEEEVELPGQGKAPSEPPRAPGKNVGRANGGQGVESVVAGLQNHCRW